MSRREPRLSETFGAQLSVAMDEAGVKPEELARELGVAMRLVQKWRAGDHLPSMENQLRLARRFDRPLEWFFAAEGAAA